MIEIVPALPPDELRLAHYSCVNWSESMRWIDYFAKVEDLLGAPITHLDKNDPVRRKVKPGKMREAAEYLVAFGREEKSRWVFGRMESLGIEFSVQHYRENSVWANCVEWYFEPQPATAPVSLEVIEKLFEIGNTALTPFYAYVDTRQELLGKKKSSGGIDLQEELTGVFWLTYFCSAYVRFIGEVKFHQLRDELKSRLTTNTHGLTVKLGDDPNLISQDARRFAESILSPMLFVDPKRDTFKRAGQFALSFKDLQSAENAKGANYPI